MTTYTCRICHREEPERILTADKSRHLPKDWGTVTVSGLPNQQLVLCGEHMAMIRTKLAVSIA